MKTTRMIIAALVLAASSLATIAPASAGDGSRPRSPVCAIYPPACR